MDACPGRLNQVALRINRPGSYFGQCSELCGINHSFMPIGVDAVTPEQYARWFDTTAGASAAFSFFRWRLASEKLAILSAPFLRIFGPRPKRPFCHQKGATRYSSTR